jgi:hypothetical protein
MRRLALALVFALTVAACVPSSPYHGPSEQDISGAGGDGAASP